MKQGKLNSFQIKLIMVFLMVLDHLQMIPGLVPPMLTGVIHACTRCVSVWFGFAAVEGFLHTRSRLHYNLRLFGWAAGMAVGNAILNGFLQEKISNNIFLTLAIGVLILNLMDQSRNRTVNLIAALVAAAGGMFTEGGPVIIPFMLITWLTGENGRTRFALYGVLALFHLPAALEVLGMYDDPTMTVSMFLYHSEWLFVTVIPFLLLYNGERGRNNWFCKYFFYVFYPLHLWILAGIGYFAG